MARLILVQHYTSTALGPMYISSTLKRGGHDCVILIAELEPDLIESIKTAQPDLVGFQVFTGQERWALRQARNIKEQLSVPIILGGHHSTHNPNILKENECVDYLCRGEGEFALLDMMDSIQQEADTTKIQNIWARKNGIIYKNPIRDLAKPDDLPFPDRELYHRYPCFRDNSIRRFITGRGCLYKCAFCHNYMDMQLYKGKGTWARKRSAPLVIEEIKEVLDKYPMKIIDFSPDDFFLSDRQWALEFLELYKKEIGWPFVLNTRPETIDEDIAKALNSAGCRGVAISIETADDKLRNEVLNKQTKTEDMRKAMRCLKNYRLVIKTYNMIGIPNETLEQALETLKLNMEFRPTWARCSIISPYPNTQIWNKGVKDGNIDPESVDKFSDNYIDETLFKAANKKEIINLQRFFAICARYPFLFPVVKLIIKLPRNKLFDIIGKLAFGYYATRYWGYSFKDIMKYGFRFMKTGQPP